MKNNLLIIILFIYNFNYSQTTSFENKKTENLIQIWGILKYKHPNISRGNIDFDNQFLKELEKIKLLKTQEQLNSEFIKWINSFDSKKEKIKIKASQSDKLFTKNEDYSWITNSNFNDELVELLNQIKSNTNYGKYYAFVNKMSSIVDFNNDKEFVNFNIKKEGHRLLFLASFWNKMRYWNVNIYLTETKWNKVLQNIIPDFFNANNLSKFGLAKDKLFASLNDSHSNYNFSALYNNPKRKHSLYGGRIINDTLVIKTIFNSHFANEENIELNDLIYSINGKKLKHYLNKKFLNRISVSNKNRLKASLESFLLLSSTSSDSLKIGVLKKNGVVREQKIKLYKFSKKNFKPERLIDTLSIIKWKNIKQGIGYINLKKINKSELKKAFKSFKNTKGIIIDLRNYPTNLKATDVPYFLYPKKKVFIKILSSDGPAIGKYDTQSALKIFKNPFAAGRGNKNYYKGKVILLVDRNTGSMAEYFAMAIQNSPNCITIGEQTFGAVMNRTEVVLKDKTKIDFTGLGSFYPNDLNVQRQGLKINYKVKEKAKGNNIYEYIDKAIKIIQEN